MLRQRFLVIVLPVLGAVLALAVLTGARHLWADTLASGNIPELMSYQGYLSDSSGNPISGTKTLTFTIYDASSGGNPLWTETHSSVAVIDGFFSVLLGDAGTPLTPSVFNGDVRYLEVAVDGTTLPRQRLASVPYAFQAYQAERAVDASTAITATYAYSLVNGAAGDGYANVVVVAKSGGDYTSVSDAMDSISPSSSSRYLILVMPGEYNERVEVKEYVHIRGAGPYLTYITAQIEDANINNPTAATLVLPANSQLSELSVINTGAAQDSAAIRVANGNTVTALNNVRALANTSGGVRHAAIYLSGGTANLAQVYAEAAGALTFNRAVNTNGSSPVIDSSTLVGDGGDADTSAYGLFVGGGNITITNSSLSGINVDTGVAYGIETNGNSEVRIDHAIIIGEDFGVRLSQSGDDAFIGATRLEGGANAETGATFRCAQSYDQDFVELAPNCKPVP